MEKRFGTYNYSEYLYERGLIKYSVKVEILAESEKSYTIKLLAPNVRGHKQNDIIRVHKKSVAVPKETHTDCSNAWWHN